MHVLGNIKVTLLKELDSRIQRTSNERQKEAMIAVRMKVTSLGDGATRAETDSLLMQCLSRNLVSRMFADSLLQMSSRLEEQLPGV